jgi:hypothetical protein
MEQKLEDKCKHKHWDITQVISKDEETSKKIIKHLQTNPAYVCYFCDGYNYNCEEYAPKTKERI